MQEDCYTSLDICTVARTNPDAIGEVVQVPAHFPNRLALSLEALQLGGSVVTYLQALDSAQLSNILLVLRRLHDEGSTLPINVRLYYMPTILTPLPASIFYLSVKKKTTYSWWEYCQQVLTIATKRLFCG